jgi:putative transposase
LVALLIDGVHFGKHVVMAAVGVDERGAKHVLGLREGATENAAGVRALLADLVERGLNPNRALLVVIDGAKALHKAVVEVFGAPVLIQRCREHKKRNVTEALPERMRASVRSAMSRPTRWVTPSALGACSTRPPEVRAIRTACDTLRHESSEMVVNIR